MNKLSYDDQAKDLGHVIDTAVASLQMLSPSIWDERSKEQFISTYLSWKERLMNIEPKYKNVKSLSYVRNDVFTYFQEGSGEAVEFFWQQINAQGLKYKRENKLSKILKRKRIKNRIEYDFIIDVMIPYQQEGIIDAEEIELLNQLLLEYENLKADK